MEAILVKVDRNGTKYYSSCQCRKCGGTGYLPGYEYIDGARCWKCGATGRENPYTWKEYTPEYAKKLADKRRAKAIAKSPEANRKFFEEAGFDTAGKTYIVLGDTYAMREALKEAGAKFSLELGWHFPQKNDKFEGFEISIADVADMDDLGVWRMRWSEVRGIVNKMRDEHAPKSGSEYIGNVGDTITVIAKLESIYMYETHFSYYGETNYIYKFKDESGNTILWKTSSRQEVEEGETYEVKGKIKEHSEYKGDKQTVLTRCKIK